MIVKDLPTGPKNTHSIEAEAIISTVISYRREQSVRVTGHNPTSDVLIIVSLLAAM